MMMARTMVEELYSTCASPVPPHPMRGWGGFYGTGILNISRGDINGVGEDEVTVTSAERTNKQTNKQTNRGERAAVGGGLDQDPKSGDVALGIPSCLCAR